MRLGTKIFLLERSDSAYRVFLEILRRERGLDRPDVVRIKEIKRAQQAFDSYHVNGYKMIVIVQACLETTEHKPDTLEFIRHIRNETDFNGPIIAHSRLPTNLEKMMGAGASDSYLGVLDEHLAKTALCLYDRVEAGAHTQPAEPEG